MIDNAPPWFRWSLAEIGIRETPGRLSTDRILAYRKIGKVPLAGEDSVVPWCAIFANAALESAGIKGTRSGMARSFLSWGVPLAKPALGCIVVLNRPPSKTLGHVGFYRGETPDFVYLLGGNQGDAVTISPFPKARVLAYRWPAGVAPPARPGVVHVKPGRKIVEVSDR